MSPWKIITGVVIGVGAVAAAPFTGGGSVLGAASLAVSLSGAAASAVAAGVVGGVAGGMINKKEKENQAEENHNHFDNGYKAGEEETKRKFHKILRIQRDRDEFLLLITQIGTYVAKCDGCFDPSEKRELDEYIGIINTSYITPQTLKDRIIEITQNQYTFSEVVVQMQMFLSDRDLNDKKECISFVNKLITDMVNADNILHPAEKDFQEKWNQIFY